MKKKLAFLLFPLLICGLTSCVLYNGQGKPNKSKAADSSAAPASSTDSASSAAPASSVTPPDPTHHDIPDDAQAGEKVTVYLVFGQYGKYENEFVNDVEGEPLYLEHVKKMTEMTVGSPLPGADKVTSSVKDSVFDTWVMYKNDGKLTKYSTVPAIKDAILYATFKGGSGGGSSGGGSGGGSVTPSEYKGSSTDAEDTPATGYGFKFLGQHLTYMSATKVDDFDGFEQYKLTARAFKKNQEFQLYNFADQTSGWVVNIDQYSFGGSDTRPTEWQKYLSNDGTKYTVLQDFNSPEIYIKIKYEQYQLYFALG